MKWLLLACMLAAPVAAMAQGARPAAPPDSVARASRSNAAPVTPTPSLDPARDPGAAGAALLQATDALRSLDPAKLRAARTALEGAGAPAGATALALTLARVCLHLGDYGAAVAAAFGVVDDPELGGRALRVLGIAHLHQPGAAEDGARAYLRGAARPATAAAYFGDALPLATPNEVSDWRAAAGDSARAAWVTDFWTRRAAGAGITVADRLTEHFRRLAVADHEYRRRGATPDTATLGGHGDRSGSNYDDRGLVYLRYGAPDQVESRGDGRIWAYWLRGRSVRFLFDGNRLSDGTTLLDARPTTGRADVALSFGTPYDAAIDLVQSLAGNDPDAVQLIPRLNEARLSYLNPVTPPPPCRRRECPAPTPVDATTRAAAAANSARDLPYLRQELATFMRRRLAVALASEDPRPTFERAVPFFYDLATFRGAEGRTDVVAALAIPGSQLPAIDLPDGRALYTPRVQLALADPATGRAAIADSSFRLAAPHRLRPGEFLRVSIELAAPPSHLAIHRVTMRVSADSAVGQAYGGAAPVPDYTGAHLALSDVVLAADEPTGTWTRGDVVLSFMPARHFAAGSRLKLFYEIYGLPAGTAYRTGISLESEKQGAWRPVRELFGDRPDLALRFEGAAQPDAGGTQQEVRVIQPDLRPGRYRIVIQVTNLATAEIATRERTFDLLP